MRVLIFGKSGQLARALQRSLLARSETVYCFGSDDLDLLNNTEKAADIIRRLDVTAVINASAYTDVDGAETQGAVARILNAKAPGIMAAACKTKQVPFIHISTDYVFDGHATKPYRVNDATAPLNAYGRSKLAGERAVLAAGGQSLILRTSWLYDGTGRNFLTTMLNAAMTGNDLKLVNNQFGRPTYAGHLAEACLKALETLPIRPAIYHLSNSGAQTNWAGFAREIFAQSGLSPTVTEVPDTAFPRPAKRPLYSGFDISDFEKDFNHVMLPWQSGITEALLERSHG